MEQVDQKSDKTQGEPTLQPNDIDSKKQAEHTQFIQDSTALAPTAAVPMLLPLRPPPMVFFPAENCRQVQLPSTVPKLTNADMVQEIESIMACLMRKGKEVFVASSHQARGSLQRNLKKTGIFYPLESSCDANEQKIFADLRCACDKIKDNSDIAGAYQLLDNVLQQINPKPTTTISMAQ